MTLGAAGYSSLIKELEGCMKTIMPYLLLVHACVLQDTSLGGFFDNKSPVSLATDGGFDWKWLIYRL
jgi:hypothetical protein